MFFLEELKFNAYLESSCERLDDKMEGAERHLGGNQTGSCQLANIVTAELYKYHLTILSKMY